MKVAEWRGVTAAQFTREILPAGQPAVLRGLVDQWPAVQAGRASPAAMVDYLRGFSTSANVNVMTADPAAQNTFAEPRRVAPVRHLLGASAATLERPLPAHSLTVLRVPAR